MKKQTLKLTFFICLISFISIACVKETKKVEMAEISEGDAKPTPTIAENTPETSGGALETPTPTPTPFTGQEVVFKGENAEIITKEDLMTSLENQEHPNMWFEYKDEKGDLIKKELSKEVLEIIQPRWKTHLTSLYHEHITDDKNAIYESTFSNSMEITNSITKLRQLEVDLPKSRKKFTENEIVELLGLQGKLGTKRFEELDKHFKK